MVVLILLSVSAIYIAVAVLIAFGIYKLTRLKSLAVMLLLLIVVAPVHEGIFGYPRPETLN
jgi:predicted cobalt transporter CbtA